MIYRNKENGQLLEIGSKLQSDIWELVDESIKKSTRSRKGSAKKASEKSQDK